MKYTETIKDQYYIFPYKKDDYFVVVKCEKSGNYFGDGLKICYGKGANRYYKDSYYSAHDDGDIEICTDTNLIQWLEECIKAGKLVNKLEIKQEYYEIY